MLVAGGIRDPLKQDLALEFCRKKNKSINILTETHINPNQIHHIRNNYWLGRISFSLGGSHTKRLLFLLHPGLEGITEVDTDQKRRFVPFKVTLSNDGVLCVYAPSGYNTKEQLTRGRFFKGLEKYMENKNEGNKIKIIRRGFSCTMDKMDRYGGNKTQRLYRYCSNYTLLKLIVDDGLEGIWRRETPDFPEFTRYDRSLDKDSAYSGSILI